MCQEVDKVLNQREIVYLIESTKVFSTLHALLFSSRYSSSLLKKHDPWLSKIIWIVLDLSAQYISAVETT